MSAESEPQRLVTLEEWENLDEDDDRELVDGVLVESEMVDVVHETVLGELFAALHAHAAARGGYAFAAGLKYAVSQRRGRIPDISLFLKPPRRRYGAQRRPADVLVEIISRTPRDQRRDRVAKVADYAAFEAPRYWIIDPYLRVFELYELRDQHYARVASASEGKLAVPGIDGLVLDLDAIWARVDALPDDPDEDEDEEP